MGIFKALSDIIKELIQQGSEIPTIPSRATSDTETLDGLPERYKIIRKLEEQGGIGTVFKAFDQETGLEVAIKSHETSMNNCFKREIFSSQALAENEQNRHIVPILDYPPGYNCLVMPYINGGNLRKLIRIMDLDVELVVALTAQICDALDAIHQAGIVHRDIKPENIMIHNSPISVREIDQYDLKYGVIVNRKNKLIRRAKVTDFGVSYTKKADKFEIEGIVVGTPHYMAPETWDGASTNPASDVYALGISIYEMFTGQVPHNYSSVSQVIIAHKECPIPRHYRIDDKVLKLVEDACEKNPDNRPKPLELIEYFRRAVYG